ncbi:ComF family protein [Paenibacillus sp. DCT19]|uniref:ComF family protein n=1 Tax=Paenibacillus sp. DCT19 TaxID=2211212 RepID=UPI000FE22A27|nr:ComF family protein [Paenibacillus sp. DCT19]
MPYWLDAITEHLQPLTRRLHHLLAPPGVTCLTCNTRSLLSSTYPGICLKCVERIPWIRSIRCPRCGRGMGCPDCARPHMQNRSFTCNRSAVQYNELMKEWIGMYKFRGHQRYAPLLTSLLVQAFQAMSEEMTAALAKEPLAPVAHAATFAQNQVNAGQHPPRPSAPHEGHAQQNRSHTSADVRANLLAATRNPLSLLQSSKPRWRPDAVTYVPVSAERLAERGFNQAERLAAGLAAATRLPLVDLLQRQINTTKQSFKTRGERIQTMQDAFAIQPNGVELLQSLQGEAHYHSQVHPLQLPATSSIYEEVQHSTHPSSMTNPTTNLRQPLRLLLVDDIYTTGSTLDVCGRVILNTGYSHGIPIEIYTLTLARS